ncbi:MAG: hypothetical protein JWQ09_5572 [Segetibacter sp.]|nr:hypothetical protein [Segetibacter sp.]
MHQVNKLRVLNTLIKHETLTIHDLSKEENLGIPSNPEDLQTVLNQLLDNGFVNALDNVSPATYTITDQGILEGTRLNEKVEA